ncbi:uncharacterized protein EV420DRAFT_23028 [Desarmillaria tabescens]|uniref:Uncharacterized protein n=1 Tax=Armillaria tabescens TaxID=1929756 RepID=A0AA39NPH0_ARMTA|nr:uncharacterized protein EV420DRAFT_23028 [Desarmillaria tabescens]KAK0469310.1 hypothetical protein EV420DRAFT_23028 [Desarmillaria tabescens]
MVNEIKRILAAVQAAQDTAAFYARTPYDIPSVLKERVEVVPALEYDRPNTIDDEFKPQPSEPLNWSETMLRRFHYQVSPIRDYTRSLALQFRLLRTSGPDDSVATSVQLDIEYGDTKSEAFVCCWENPTRASDGERRMVGRMIYSRIYSGVDGGSETLTPITFLELLLGEEVWKAVNEFNITLRGAETTLEDVIAEKTQRTVVVVEDT